MVEFTRMIQVTRKDSAEANENLIRRFNRKVQQSGILARVKELQFFAKPLSKLERRKRAIVRKARKADKLKRMRLGQR
jgi:ribosomal protein S21